MSRGIVASEVVEYEDDKLQMRETISRIIEFGLEYHSVALVEIAEELGIAVRVEKGMTGDIPGLYDSE